MTNEEIEKFRLGCQKVLKEMSEEEFNQIYSQWEAFDHTFAKAEKTVIIAKILEDFTNTWNFILNKK
jgi:hypothetical protein